MGRLGWRSRKEIFFFPSNLFTRRGDGKKKHRNGIQSAERRAIYRSTRFDRIVFFVRDVLFELEREIRFSGFPLVL